MDALSAAAALVSEGEAVVVADAEAEAAEPEEGAVDVVQGRSLTSLTGAAVEWASQRRRLPPNSKPEREAEPVWSRHRL
jgi:hypothetical protein